MNTLKSKILAYLTKGLLTALLATCKIEIQGLQELEKKAQQGPCIIMLWHNRLLIIGYILSKFTKKMTYSAFVSNSKDGRILAEFVDSYKRGRSIKVAHNARGQALKKLIEELRQRSEVALITPDGPRGPKYKIKPGVIRATEAASASTIPLSWSATEFWQLRTWDNLIVPKPFSKIYVVFGSAIQTAEHDLFKSGLDDVTKTACHLAQSVPV
ncbi:hypothetical protein PHSC3_000187 [Chlamydiales bacterium STE3]|nr:hypothetical protein PHSC3_000187 [Chlamydiales bacterium STE3]